MVDGYECFFLKKRLVREHFKENILFVVLKHSSCVFYINIQIYPPLSQTFLQFKIVGQPKPRGSFKNESSSENVIL